MERTEYVYAAFGVLALAAFLLLSFGSRFLPLAFSGPREINSFESCAFSGYTLIESYPRKCITPEGKVFVEDVSPEDCEGDYECMDGYFCDMGNCSRFVPDASCSSSADCSLINSRNRFRCCWAGACEAIDYSLPQWVAVNSAWFGSERAERCPDAGECGPAPLCAARIVDDGWKAACINSTCTKIQVVQE